MRFFVIFKILGIMLMVLSASQLPPIFVAYLYRDGGISAFVFAFAVTFFFGFFLWFFTRKLAPDLKTRDGFLVVTLLWIVLSFFSAIPLLMTLYPKISFTNAMFESVSGLTTTGATIFSHFEHIPHAILYYRQQLHFLGGMGVVVLAVAVLPMLGIGGLQLYRAEMAGPNDSDKLTPRIAHTAKMLWSIYFGLALLAILAFHFLGLTWFQSVGASFTTVSTGGFSLHDSSFAYYHSTVIDIVAIVFMILGGTNFALHFQFLKRRNPLVYFKDPEFCFYLLFYLFIALIIAVTLSIYNYMHIGQNFLNAFFMVISIGTTTGITTTNFNLWPTFIPYLLMFVALIGGCAGSTSGGLKMLRCLVLRQQARREMHRLIHPKAIYAVKLGKHVVPERTLQSVWGFMTAFIVLFILLLMLVLSTGLDFRTSFGALSACFSNTGIGIGHIADGFGNLHSSVKWLLIFAMIAGRLEIFTIIILLMPSYWKN